MVIISIYLLQEKLNSPICLIAATWDPGLNVLSKVLPFFVGVGGNLSLGGKIMYEREDNLDSGAK